MQIIKNNKFLFLIIFLAIVYLIFQLLFFKNQSWENYVYVHQDFWRRMEDAQYYLGLRGTGQFHPPLTSLLYSILLLFGINQLYILNFLVNVGFAILIFLICKKFTNSPKASFITSIAYLTNYSIIQQANYLGLSDLFASFIITLGVYLFISRRITYKLLITIGILFGAAGLIQYSGVFSVPLIIILIGIKKDLSFKQKFNFILAFGLSVSLVFGSFFLYRYILFKDPFYSAIEHFGFFKLNFNNIGFYLFSTLAFFKIPVILISLIGLLNNRRNFRELKLILLLLPSFLFFVFLYSWTDWRFEVYLIPIIYLLFSKGLVKVYSFFKQKKFPTVLVLIILAIFIYYNNLYLFGNFGIVLTSNQVLRLDIKYFDGKQVNSFTLDNSLNNFKPYYFINSDWNVNSKNDGEVNYYTKTTDYSSVLGISKIIGSKKYVLILNTERFVRYHQFSVATKLNPILDPNDQDLTNTIYIVSDYLLESYKYRNFTLESKFNNLYLYKNL